MNYGLITRGAVVDIRIIPLVQTHLNSLYSKDVSKNIIPFTLFHIPQGFSSNYV